jgi:hypothetical protein
MQSGGGTFNIRFQILSIQEELWTHPGCFADKYNGRQLMESIELKALRKSCATTAAEAGNSILANGMNH